MVYIKKPLGMSGLGMWCNLYGINDSRKSPFSGYVAWNDCYKSNLDIKWNVMTIFLNWNEIFYERSQMVVQPGNQSSSRRILSMLHGPFWCLHSPRFIVFSHASRHHQLLTWWKMIDSLAGLPSETSHRRFRFNSKILPLHYTWCQKCFYDSHSMLHDPRRAIFLIHKFPINCTTSQGHTHTYLRAFFCLSIHHDN